MTPQDPGGSDYRPADLAPTNCTLKPIAEQGADALPADPAEGILEVKLHRLQLVWANDFHDVTTLQSDDVFHPTAPHAISVPPALVNADLTQATLDFRLSDTTHLCAVDIRPPNEVRFSRPKHARRLAAWLSKHDFLRSPVAALSQLLTILVLALAAIIAALPDDDTDDPDDDDHHHHASSHT